MFIVIHKRCYISSELQNLENLRFLYSLPLYLSIHGAMDARWKNVPQSDVGSCFETFYNISNLFVWTGENPMTGMFALFLKHKATLLASKTLELQDHPVTAALTVLWTAAPWGSTTLLEMLLHKWFSLPVAALPKHLKMSWRPSVYISALEK